MSIDVKDHRRYAEGKLAESIKAAETKLAEAALLPQVDSEVANTGNEQLDKLIRVVEDLCSKIEPHVTDLAHKGMGSVQDELFRMHQIQYAFAKGQLAAYEEVKKIPARIILESKPTLHLV